MTFRTTSIAVLSAAMALPPAAVAQTPERPERSARAARVEEIVVRARKRDELLQDTPVSVTAISGSVLEQSGITRLDEIQSLVPNTFFQVGRSNQDTNLRIRGVGAGSFEIAFDPGVGVYVDGVFLPRALGALVELFDVSQIDVLRGPQGTLFGKNTVGGAILIRTIRPQEELSGSVSLRSGFLRDFSDLNSTTARAMLNVPLVEQRILSRFSFMSKNNEGYVADAGHASDKSNTNSYSFLGSLRFLPTDDLTIDVSGSYGRDHNNGRGGQCVFFNEDAPLRGIIPGFVEECSRSRPYSIHTDVNGVSDLESTGVWGVAQWQAIETPAFDLSVRALGAWRRQHPRISEDLDSTRLGVIQISSVGGSLRDGIPGFQQQFNSELQLTANTWEDRASIVAGVFGLWERARFEPTTTAGAELATPLSETTARSEIDNWTWAFFTQASVDATDWLGFSLGGRYTRDKKGAVAFIRDRRTFPTIDADVDDSGREVFERWTGMADLRLTLPDSLLTGTPIDSLMTYYRFSQGFRGGGFNAILGQEGATDLPSFRQETLDNHEVGIKTQLLDSRLRMNLALFRGDYDDIQVITIRATEDPGSPTMVRIDRVTQNAAKATTQGVEVELSAVPLAGLNLTGSFGWIDAHYDSFPTAADELRLCSPQEFNDGLCNRDRSGESFDRVPRLEGSFSIQYALPVDSGHDWLSGTLLPRVSWSYRDSYHLFSRQVRPLIQSGYHLLNARLGYEFFDERLGIALWAKNLTDEAYFNEGTPIQSSFGSVTRYFNWPRTFGIDLRYNL